MASTHKTRSTAALYLVAMCIYFATFVSSTESPSNGLCDFCKCHEREITCAKAFRLGAQLDYILKDPAFSTLNIINIYPPTFDPELFQEYRNTSKLTLAVNYLSRFDSFSILQRLIYLDLSYNLFQHVPTFNSYSSLEVLVMRYNDIHDIPHDMAIAFSNLKTLSMNNNQLVSVYAKYLPPKLIKLELSGNMISRFSLAGLNFLVQIDLSNNRISEISPTALFLPNLNYINLSHNRITNINLGYFPVTLLHIDLSENKISDFSTEMENQTYIRSSTIHKTNVTELQPSTTLENLQTIFISSVTNQHIIHHLLSSSPRITYFSMTSGRLDRVNLATQTTLTYLELSFSKMKIIENVNTLTSLEFFIGSNNLLISSPNFSGMQRLEEVNLSKNEIVIISASNYVFVPLLKTIFLEGNNIKTIHGHFFLQNLKEIQLSRNIINIIDETNASIFRNTKVINLSRNNLKVLGSTTISMSVRELILSDNMLNLLPKDSLTLLYQLKTLLLETNKISHIEDLPYLPKLDMLILNNNPIRFIAKDVFLQTPRLRRLDMKHVEITVFPELVDHYPNIEMIELSYNLIETFPKEIIQYFPNLISLLIAGNRMSDCNCDVLTELDKLEFVDVSDNPIRQFELNSSLPFHSLKRMAIGSKRTEFIGQQWYESFTNLDAVVLKGSKQLQVPSTIFCVLRNTRLIEIIGLNLSVTIDKSCFQYLEGSHIVVSDTTIEDSTMRGLISHTKSAFLMKIKIVQDEAFDTITYAANLTYFTYVNSGLTEIPRVFAHSVSGLDLRYNILSHLHLCTLITFYPNLNDLDLSHNRIQVLSSCENDRVPRHPLTQLNLNGNDLGRSKHDAFWDGFRILSSLNLINLKSNNLSFLGRGLVPTNGIDRPPYHLLTILADRNPLICDCRQRWLMAKANHTANVPSGRCSEPLLHKGRSLKGVIEMGFPCPLMMLTKEDIPMCDSENGTVRIRCPVISYPSPSIFWFLEDDKSTTKMTLGNITISTRLVEEKDFFGHIVQEPVLEVSLQEAINLTDRDINNDTFFDLSLTCRGSHVIHTLDIDINIRVVYGLLDVRSGIAENVSFECHAVQNDREECATTGTTVKGDCLTDVQRSRGNKGMVQACDCLRLPLIAIVILRVM